jgi:DNA-binding CsgD family transcriptional regulator
MQVHRARRWGERHQVEVDDAIAQLGELRLGGPPAIDDVLGLLGRVGAGRAFAYGLHRADSGVRLSWISGQRIDSVRLAEMIESGAFHYAYDPLQPQASQRNRILKLQDLSAQSGVPIEALRDASAANVQVAHLDRVHVLDQPRMLMCHRGLLLAWIGIVQSDCEPEDLQAQTLQALSRPLRKRLRLEGQLRQLALTDAVLPVALDNLGAPALLVDRFGAVVLANAAAQTYLRGSAPRGELRTMIRRGKTGWEVTPIHSNGIATLYLVIQNASEASVHSRVTDLRAYWGLTNREAEILQHVATGLSNRLISAKLRVSERTVEVHITHLLSKSGSASRSRLVARLFASSM